jgi:hypothetical protein
LMCAEGNLSASAAAKRAGQARSGLPAAMLKVEAPPSATMTTVLTVGDGLGGFRQLRLRDIETLGHRTLPLLGENRRRRA